MAAGETAALQPREPPLFLPLVAALATSVVLWVPGLLMFGMPVRVAFAAALLVLVLALLHAVLLGIPYAILLRRRNRFTAGWMLLGGALIGGLPLGAIVSFHPASLTAGACVGGASAWAFFAMFRCLSR